MNRYLLLVILTVIVYIQDLSSQVKISYTIDPNLSECDITKLENSEWFVYESPVYQERDSGSICFKLTFDQKSSETYELEIPSIYTFSPEFYGIDSSLIKKDKSSLQKYRFATKDFQQPIYVKVACVKKSFVPIEVYDLDENSKKERVHLIFYTIYYTFVVAILVFTFFSYYQHRDKSALIYIILMIVVNIARAIAEGNLSLFVENNFLIIVIDYLTHGIIAYVGFHFTVNYIGVSSKFRVNLLKIVTVTLVCSTSLLIVYVITENSWFAFFSDLFVIICVNSILFSGVYYFRKNVYARFYCYAYFPLMFAAYDVYFLEPLGIKLISMNFLEYRIGMTIEMVVLALAVAYRGRKVIKINEEMNQTIRRMAKEMKTGLSKAEQKLIWKEKVMNEYGLTKQEFSVLELIVDKKTNRQIAEELFVSINTAKFHAKNIYKKLDINSRNQVEEKIRPKVNTEKILNEDS